MPISSEWAAIQAALKNAKDTEPPLDADIPLPTATPPTPDDPRPPPTAELINAYEFAMQLNKRWKKIADATKELLLAHFPAQPGVRIEHTVIGEHGATIEVAVAYGTKRIWDQDKLRELSTVTASVKPWVDPSVNYKINWEKLHDEAGPDLDKWLAACTTTPGAARITITHKAAS